MGQSAIADTGPLVAYFDRREAHHEWAVAQMNSLTPPLLVNEPVLAEAMFLLRRYREAADALMDLTERGVLQVAFHLDDHIAEVRSLLQEYADLPASLADASIVRMSELNERHRVLTLDSDFAIYRRFGREPLPLLMPN